ncbi:hypothetical protein cypCar_00030225 [Cyprinus carpio]|nr:hypothetical protein cypCar_00030225 [Cyprinus carpio]
MRVCSPHECSVIICAQFEWSESVISLSKLPLKNKYRNLFNTIFCSASMVHQLDSSLREITAPDAALVIELAKYLLDLSKEQVSGFSDRVTEIAGDSGFSPVHIQRSDIYMKYSHGKKTKTVTLIYYANKHQDHYNKITNT